MLRSFGALVGDLLIALVFVSIGLVQHGTPLTMQNVSWVAWPFAVGVLLGHLAIRAWRAPFALWPQGVFVWAITIAAAMMLRTLLGEGTDLSFVLVAAGVTGVLMLGWRALALFLTRGERVSPPRPAPASAQQTADATEPDTAAPEQDAAPQRD